MAATAAAARIFGARQALLSRLAGWIFLLEANKSSTQRQRWTMDGQQTRACAAEAGGWILMGGFVAKES